jgi:hypothetical protein
MNAEVQVHIGEVHNALAVPNAALRPRDELDLVAASLGLTMDEVRRQLGQGSGDEEDDEEVRSEVRGRGGRSGDRDRGNDGRAAGGDRDREASLFGGEYVVFALRNGVPRAVAVRTGLTDFDYTAVVDGLSPGDTVYILPTAGLMEERQERQERARERAGSPLGDQGRGRGGGR